MKKVILCAVILMALFNNTIISLLILSALAVIGVSALVKNSPEYRG